MAKKPIGTEVSVHAIYADLKAIDKPLLNAELRVDRALVARGARLARLWERAKVLHTNAKTKELLNNLRQSGATYGKTKRIM